MSAAAKRLSELLDGIVELAAADDRLVHDVIADSREVRPRTLFLALPGLRYDGRTFIDDAVKRGAAAVVYDTDGFVPPQLSVPAIGVKRLARHVSAIADRFYDAPSRRLTVIGVTGTNGKTTCTQVLAQALDNTNRGSELTLPPPSRGRDGERGQRASALPLSPIPSPTRGEGGEPMRANARATSLGRCAVIGTLGYGFPGALDTGLHTTPDAVTTQRLLAKFADAGAAYATMEVSSHALAQERVRSIRFRAAVFTNLTRDHLDYHADMEDYAAAKARLFLDYGVKTVVINRDDEYGRRLIAMIPRRTAVISYGLSAGDVHAADIAATPAGLRIRAVTPKGGAQIEAPFLGDFNALNLLAALATLLALGFEADDAAARLSGVRPVPGRVERFKGADDRPLVVVDYAHTPDALEQVLKALRPHVAGRLWCVFGCGGNRDRGKRPQMGAIAERLADRVILTDDNPRHESGDAIVQDIAAGMRARPRVIRDRRQAIAVAIGEAHARDVVLVAGKGHEEYQQIGDERHRYSDRDTVRELLRLAA